MSRSLTFFAVYALIYALAVIGECISQITYRKRSLQAIRENLRSTLLRTFILVTIMTISFLFWLRMGWQPHDGP